MWIYSGPFSGVLLFVWFIPNTHTCLKHNVNLSVYLQSIKKTATFITCCMKPLKPKTNHPPTQTSPKTIKNQLTKPSKLTNKPSRRKTSETMVRNTYRRRTNTLHSIHYSLNTAQASERSRWHHDLEESTAPPLALPTNPILVGCSSRVTKIT